MKPMNASMSSASAGGAAAGGARHGAGSSARPAIAADACRTGTSVGGGGSAAGLLHPEGDPRLLQVVGAHLHLHRVARGDLDEVFPQLPGNVRQHDVPVRQLHLEHRARQHRDHLALDFDRVAVRHDRARIGRGKLAMKVSRPS